MSDTDGRRVNPPDPPIDPSEYDISVKLPDEVVAGRHVHEYLDQLAARINESDDVQIMHDDDSRLRQDDTGSYWADATMTIYYQLGSCPGRRPEGPGAGMGEDDDGED